LKFRINYKL